MSAEGDDLAMEEWLQRVLANDDDPTLIRQRFPSDRLRDEYLQTVQTRSESDVRQLIKCFLVESRVTPRDEMAFDALMDWKANDPDQFEKVMELEYYQRVHEHFSGNPDVLPWEGNTWILDLLPHHPRQALDGLSAYIFAHLQILTDNLIWGLNDAAELIRAKYIGIPGTNDTAVAFLFDVGWRGFECLTERLYHAMGYDTELTPPRKDGGRDVIARKGAVASREHVLVECKLYSDPIGVETVRTLQGVVADAKATKGVLVTASTFTDDAREWADRNPLELINGDEFVRLLNEHLGSKWSLHIEALLRSAEAPGVHRSLPGL